MSSFEAYRLSEWVRRVTFTQDEEIDCDELSVTIEVVVEAGDEGIRFLLVSGRPIEEPVAWHGPIVMNTQAELRQAVMELQLGTFIK